MASPRHRSVSEEPIGIVISRGAHEESTPRFSAYIWAPAPEANVQTREDPAS